MHQQVGIPNEPTGQHLTFTDNLELNCIKITNDEISTLITLPVFRCSCVAGTD